MLELIPARGKKIAVFTNHIQSPHFISTNDIGDVKNMLFKNETGELNTLFKDIFGTDILKTIDSQHGDGIVIVNGETPSVVKADSIFEICPNNETGKNILALTTGDCPHILVEGSNKHFKIAGGAHSGWKGTALNIVGKSIAKIAEMGFPKKMLKVAVWPGICPNCYEVGHDVKKELRNYRGHIKQIRKGKWSLDLAGIIKEQLLEAGISDNNIATASFCPHCYRDEEKKPLFYSYRNGDKVARNGLFIMV